MLPKKTLFILVGGYFFSGACALVSEIVWARQIQIFLGSSTLSVSAILITFMSGITLGSYSLGRSLKSSKHPLLLYCFLEAGIGLLTLFLLWFYPFLLSSLHLSTIWRYFLTIILFSIPTFLMGGTFPILNEVCKKLSATEKNWPAILYGYNVLGGTLGALMGGFFLIYHLGLKHTLILTSSINLSIACVSALIYKKASNASPHIETFYKSNPSQKLQPNVGMFCLFIVGFISMMYEVLTTRLLAIVLGSSTYAFTLILTTFLLGLALGNFLLSKISQRTSYPLLWLMGLQVILGFFILTSLCLQDQLPLFFYKLFPIFENSFWSIQGLQFLICTLILLVPTNLIGASFPFLIRIGQSTVTDKYNSLGTLYAINSLGNTFGALLTSLILLPFYGLEKTFKVNAFISIALAALLSFYLPYKKSTRIMLMSGILTISLLLFKIPHLDLKLLTSGISLSSKNYHTLGLSPDRFIKEIAPVKILFSKDGWTSHVTVRKHKKVQSLLINGKVEGSNGQDLQTELLVAHLPLLLHSQTENVFVIGLGTGITLRAIETYPVKTITCVEIEKRVLEASQLFKKHHHNALSDPRLKLMVEDARHVLSSSSEKYDCIISEPSNPWMAGIGSLYTIEMFQEIKNHLNEKGVVCQWVHYYNMSPNDLKTIVRTFQTVFPNSSLWGQAHLSDLFLIGFKDPDQKFQIPNLNLSNPKTRKDLHSIGLSNTKILQALQYLDKEELAAFAGQGKLHTDDLPILEFSAPQALYQDTLSLNLKEILKFRKNRILKHEKAMTFYLQAMENFYNKNEQKYFENLSMAFQKSPKWQSLYQLYENAVYKETQRLFEDKKEREALDLLEKALPFISKSSRIQYTLGFLYQQKEAWEKAKACYQKTVKINPRFAQAYNNLGAVYLQFEENDLAYQSFKKALELDPFYIEAHLNLGYCLLQQKALEAAELEFKLCIGLNSQLASAYNGLGVVLAMQKKFDQATEQFKEALELEPQNSEAKRNLEKMAQKLND